MIKTFVHPLRNERIYICAGTGQGIFRGLFNTVAADQLKNNNHNGAHWLVACASLVSWNFFCLQHWYTCVCPPLRALITNYVKGIYNNWLNQFYSFSVSVRIWHLQSIKWMDIALVTQRVVNAWERGTLLPNSTTNKTECFRYIGEWVNT